MTSNPAIADSNELIRLRYAAKELTNFPKLQARQMLAGGHRSQFRGRGMDFDQVRLYQPGDDVRSIDWRVTARTQVPHTKVFIEERERPILIISDLRSSMFFGSQRLKSVVACEVSAALAWAGLGINDRVGGVIFGAQEQLDFKPKRSHHTALQLIRGLQKFSQALLNSQRDKLDLATMLEESRRLALPGSTVFIVSDFHDLDSTCEPHLFSLAKHCNINFCQVTDVLERQLPKPAQYPVTNGERQIVLDTSNKQLRENFAHQFTKRENLMQKLCEQLAAGLLIFDTAEPVMQLLAKAYGKRRSGRAFN
ncbi:MAG: DUF58 domain-containing protein [Porticoccaceae bacterium]